MTVGSTFWKSTSHKTGTRLIPILCLMAALLSTPLAHAEPAAESLLRRVEKTWQASQTLTAAFTTTTLYPTYYRDSQEKGTILLARPGQVAIRLDRFRKIEKGDEWQAMGNIWTNVSDGTTSVTLLKHPDSAQYRKTPAPANADKLLENVELLNGFFAGRLSLSGEARLLDPTSWEGVEYQVVETRAKNGTVVAKLYIGSDGFIHRALIQDNTPGKPLRREVTLNNIQVNKKIPPSAFRLTLPDGAQTFERTPARPLLAPGEEAPDFTVRDADGKSVRLSELRGSVVVLKFFATWCGSCRQSLPHTEEVIRQFVGKKVVTLLVDIWDSEKALRTWQRKNGSKYPTLRFAVDPAPQGQDIGSTLYRVSTTPTLYVIGADGKIVSAQSGYNGPTSALKEAIETALLRSKTGP